MNSAIVITRVAERHWHALEDDRVVGRGEASPRPDGRLFLSIDSWHGTVFDQLAGVMLAELPTPLYTVVDEADRDLTSHWQRTGFTTRRREWEYDVPTGVHSVPQPAGVTIVPVGEADEGPLRELDREIRAEVEASVGWLSMPAEVLPHPAGAPSKHAAAVAGHRYVGLVRVTGRPRSPRIGLIAVRAEEQRRGIARALLADVLGRLHGKGIDTASADVNEANHAAVALFEGFGARRASSNLELVLR
ncbi:ribosomal protein S18 acetylase RimI-like enzyme [Kibdelosporangium banguiense]|uniref:Ribosomal protein S18 acetylase RimI-like enzyme n=1 Tax=Kibdelosporangium banguiense TaxID=1365924 RepID=A0ABS4U0Z8_9PSEU|nr:GNAT family N-acetyltransferase [Kibdelosporangium banguiense]MBP2330334.1 ribosomal protein S18 acetylase RimI-like enzyme [Kibdelosporangium banguiense]